MLEGRDLCCTVLRTAWVSKLCACSTRITVIFLNVPKHPQSTSHPIPKRLDPNPWGGAGLAGVATVGSTWGWPGAGATPMWGMGREVSDLEAGGPQAPRHPHGERHLAVWG